jgi:cob(I)alamin adenosyltransferase
VVALAEQELISTLLQRYLNRLSDLLFVLARHLGRLAEIEEILWEREENA